MKNIKNIIVATDFSVTALNAYRYANQLATTLKASLTIVHVKENTVIISDVVTPQFSSKSDIELINDIKDFIFEADSVMHKLKLFPEANIKILKGNPEDSLIELSQSKDTDLIVIGTTGLSDVLAKIFGSISIAISNRAHCPVILVPREARWQSIQHILYASDYDSLTVEFAKDITEFAVNLNSVVHFVNVRNYDPIFEAKQKDIDWDELFVSTDSKLTFEKHTIYGNDTVVELNKYCNAKNINLITFASKHRNFWENLMHKSITENMALSNIIPIMVIHSDDV